MQFTWVSLIHNIHIEHRLGSVSAGAVSLEGSTVWAISLFLLILINFGSFLIYRFLD